MVGQGVYYIDGLAVYPKVIESVILSKDGLNYKFYSSSATHSERKIAVTKQEAADMRNREIDRQEGEVIEDFKKKRENTAPKMDIAETELASLVESTRRYFNNT